jgi:hypothetical protein
MTYRAVVLCVLLTSGLLAPLHAGQSAVQKAPGPQKPAANLSGTWAIVATFKGPPGAPDGGFRASVTLKQRDMGPLDGYLTMQNGSGGAFTGVVDDRGISFTSVFKSAERPGVTTFADFTGTIDGGQTFKGRVIMVSMGPGTYMRGEGPFVATRR